jgi:hypothetical protein
MRSTPESTAKEDSAHSTVQLFEAALAQVHHEVATSETVRSLFDAMSSIADVPTFP